MSWKATVPLMVAALGLTVGCGSSTNEPSSVSAQSSIDVASVGKEVTDGVGTVLRNNSNGKKGPVFIFEEFHTSRVGQLQIAAMLVRLHDKYGMRKIGLEGKVQSSNILNADWYRKSGGDSATEEREDLAVRMVAEGEISSAELMTMQYPDVEVYGTEDAQLYAQTLDVKGNPEVEYLIAIAEKSLGQDEIRQVNQLLNAKQEKKAFDLLMSSDPWVKQRYNELKRGDAVSSEKMLEDIHELKEKAASLGADVDSKAKQDIDQVVTFYQAASRRSDAMANKVLEIIASAKGTPIAMIIGAAHADKVAELFTAQNVNFCLIQPVDLDPKDGSLTVEQYDRKAKGLWARDAKGTLGHVLNVQRKPPPVLERMEGQGYASTNLAGMIVAKAARAHRRIPDEIWTDLSSLPDIRVDKDSFSMDGYDVIFRIWVKHDDGREKEVWSRVGTIEHPSSLAPETLDGKLVKAADDLKSHRGGGGGKKGNGKKGGGAGGDGKEPPSDLPKDSRVADNEGPGDVRKAGLVISRTGRDTLAVYGSSKEEVKGAGRISI